MKPCPECNSNKVYRYKKYIDATGGYGPELLPKLNTSWYASPQILPVVCKDCGLVRFYASKESRELLEDSKHWEPV
ncbi:MAG: hypothetical protein KDE51_02755 [Anaerolineales bacterium]|nr:hypothetical protein [Anaerolineales bacterium]